MYQKGYPWINIAHSSKKSDDHVTGLLQKRKVQQANGSTAEIPGDQQAAKVIRQFSQTKPVTDGGEKQKPGLSKDLLAGVSVFVYIVGRFLLPYMNSEACWLTVIYIVPCRFLVDLHKANYKELKDYSLVL